MPDWWAKMACSLLASWLCSLAVAPQCKGLYEKKLFRDSFLSLKFAFVWFGWLNLFPSQQIMEHSAAVTVFGPFRLVADKKELWRGEELLKVRSMPLAVLSYLAQHPEQVISVDDLRKAVWGSTRVGRGAIRVCVREIRQALGDEMATPRYIETVGRQGYRFIAPLATPPPVSSSKFQVSSSEAEGQGRQLIT